MKIAVLFVAHNYNESNIIGYNRLKNELDSNIYDVFWCIPLDVKLSDSSIKVYRYGNSYVVRKGFYNPSFILERFYVEHKQYDYYYLHEYDVTYSGNYQDLFDTLDKNEDADLIAAYIQKQSDKIYWQWWNKFKTKTDILYPDHHLLKSCLSFCRLSNKALETICGYPENRNNVLYEMSYPTICYKNNLKMVALDSVISDKEFQKNYDYCSNKWFWYCVNLTAKFVDGKICDHGQQENKLLTKIKFI